MRPIHRLGPLAILTFLVGCSGPEESAPPPADGLLAPPPEGEGVQLRMVTEIGPGEEAEHCQFVKVPPEGLHVNHDEVRYTQGSHHVVLYETYYEEIPTANEAGVPVDTSGVFDCSNGATDGWAISRVIGGSQSAAGNSTVSFPPNVAMHLKPGAVLLVNAHYINASSETIHPEVAINLHTIPADEVEQEGDVLFLYNPFIKIGAQAQGRAHMRCPVRRDITLVNVYSHMHSRGVGFGAALADGEPFYVNDRWENVPVKSFEGGFPVAAGEELDFHCDYSNAEERTVYQGPRSTDEMCILVGSYYPADTATAQCAADPERPAITRNLGAYWVGQGSSSCAETMGCVEAAFSGQEGLNGMQACIVDSDPAVSKEVSDFARCLLVSSIDAKDPQTACGAEIAACASK